MLHKTTHELEQDIAAHEQREIGYQAMIVQRDQEIIELKEQLNKALSQLAEVPKCKECQGTRMVDSGGVHPWGEGIWIPCGCPDTSGYKWMPEVPTQAMISAMASSQARDDEGEFPMLMDLIDFSGENKLHTCLIAAYAAAVSAAPNPEQAK